MTTFIKPTSDIFIKYLLGSERNKDLLLSFVNSVLKDSNFEQIVSVEIKNPFNIQSFQLDKLSILDVKATDSQGRIYNIEVQATEDKSFMVRSLYYWAKLYTSQLGEGEKYNKLKPTICINVLNFTLFENLTNVHSCFMATELNNPEAVLTDHLVIHYLELPKLVDQIAEDKLSRWLLFFKNEGIREDVMEILLKEDQDLSRAHQEYEKFSQDEQLRDLYEAREKARKDFNSAIANAEAEGEARGKAEGLQNSIIHAMSKQFGLTEAEKEFVQAVSDLEKLGQANDKALDEIIAGKKDEETRKKILDILK